MMLYRSCLFTLVTSDILDHREFTLRSLMGVHTGISFWHTDLTVPTDFAPSELIESFISTVSASVRSVESV